MMRKCFKTISIVSAIALSVSLAGCSDIALSKDTDGSEKDDSAVAVTDEDTATTDAASDEKSDDSTTDKTDDEAGEEADLDAPIYYNYQNNPYSFVADDKELAIGNYYTIELEESDKENFPELQNRLDELNDEAKEEIVTFFTDSEDEIQEMIKSGWFLAYELDHNYTPARADGRVFSYCLLQYLYLAGAHGVTSYKTYNIDPVTGKDISFSSVVENTKDLPDIIADELQKQNKDLKGYFESCPSDLQNLKDGIPGRLSNDAENLAWTLDYDGITIYFEDYAMGSYAAGSQSVKISFADYPDVFTDTYINYSDKDIPDIQTYAKELKEAESTEVAASSDFQTTFKVRYTVTSEDIYDFSDTRININEVDCVSTVNGDDEGTKWLYIDEDTVFDESCEMEYFAFYEDGDTPLSWFNKVNELRETDIDSYTAMGPALLGVFEVSISGDHIERIYGIYWWD